MNVLVLLIGFVGDQNHRAFDAAQAFDHQFIQRHQSGLDVDNQNDHIGCVDCQFDLVTHIRGQVVRVFDSHSAGVDQLKEPLVGFDQRGHPIASHAFEVVHNGQTAARKPIKDTAFADIRSADDCDLRNGHQT